MVTSQYFFSSVFFLLALQSLWHTNDCAILRVGNPLSWSVSKPYLQSVRLSGVNQFINHYNRAKSIETPAFLWGDEIEYGVFKYDQESKTCDLSFRGKELRELLNEREDKHASFTTGCVWQPEYGSWMVEAVPRDPYSGYLSDLFKVEENMSLRRKRLRMALYDNEIAPSTSNFPMLGTPGHEFSKHVFGPIANSQYVSDDVINTHPRMRFLTNNIRSRRERNVQIEVPKENMNVARNGDTADTIHMDAMAFGMGCCCLQVTMQSKSDRESRHLHDQLAVLSPLFLALSASTPIFKGELCGTDTRWDVISQAVDDRTVVESGEESDSNEGIHVADPDMVGQGLRRLAKSRYSSASLYIGRADNAEEAESLDYMNDLDAEVDDDAMELLQKKGIDKMLSQHIAHLFVRDPLVIFDDAIHLDDEKVLDHFENIQSTNWRSVRWKTPGLEVGLQQAARDGILAAERSSMRNIDTGTGDNEDGSIKADFTKDIESFGPGWRVEFRPIEVQLTDMENAAFSISIVLAARAILAMGYNFYMPLSLVEENTRRAQLKDAAIEQKFYVRKNALESRDSMTMGDGKAWVPSKGNLDTIELTLDEVFNGQARGALPCEGNDAKSRAPFPGLLPAVREYLTALNCSTKTMESLEVYLSLLQQRASGVLPTTARWMRDYVKAHREYKHDGKLTDSIAADLLKLCDDIGLGKVCAADLYGNRTLDRLYEQDAYEPYLSTDVRSIQSIPRASDVESIEDALDVRRAKPPTAAVGTVPSGSGSGVSGYQPVSTCSSASKQDTPRCNTRWLSILADESDSDKQYQSTIQL
jgi:glutamate--cysteine ligase catalytic subunit